MTRRFPKSHQLLVLLLIAIAAGVCGWLIGDAGAILRYSLFPMVTVCGVLLGWLRASGIALAGICLLLCISTSEYRNAGTTGRLDLMMWATSVGITGAIAGLYARNRERKFRRRVTDLRRLAETDPLTGLPNRRVLLRAIDAEFRQRHTGSRHCHLLLLDVDRFKSFNDRYGHDVGDEVLREVARAISSTIRHHDLAARYGGEEFAILLPETNREGAMRVAERMRSAVERLRIRTGPSTVSVTISVGGADAYEVTTPAELLEVSDARLYAAKAAGRNLVRFSGHARDETRVKASCETAALSFIKFTSECRLDDALSGLPSFQVFSAELRRRVMEYRRYGTHFSLAICWVAPPSDSSVSFDDAFLNLVTTMRRNMRETDLMSWISAQEIGILLPQTDLERSAVPIRRALKAHGAMENFGLYGATEVQFRIAEVSDEDTGDTLLARCRAAHPEVVASASQETDASVTADADGSRVPA